MKRGELCRLVCKPEYAYGEQGSGEKIKPNTTLIFEIELFDFVGGFLLPRENNFHQKFFFLLSGEDLSDSKDKSIVRRVFKKGEGWAKPNDGASVEVILKGTHENRVFDDRTVSFIVGEGFLQNIPEGFVSI